MRRLQPALLLVIFLLLPSILIALQSAEAAEVDGVSIDSDSISISPTNPIAGVTIAIEVSVDNINQQDTDVDIRFYKNSAQPGNDLTFVHMLLPASDGVTPTTSNITVFWPDVAVGDYGVYVQIIDSVSSNVSIPQFKGFTVTGLPNLAISDVSVSPIGGIHEGEQLTFEVLVENLGSEVAGTSQLTLIVEGTDISLSTAVGNISAGASQNVTLGGDADTLAPQTGSWNMIVTTDSTAQIDETDEQDNIWSGTFTVEDTPDIYFEGGLSVTTAEGGSSSVNGPWTISGTMVSNFDASGMSIPLRVTLTENGSGMNVVLDRSIIWSDSVNSHTWSLEILKSDVTGFSFGSHLISVAIDPDGNIASNVDTAEDVSSTLFGYVQPPNVWVEIVELNDEGIVDTGTTISWIVNMQNTGGVSVSGTLIATWMDVEYPYDRIITAGDLEPVRVDVDAGDEEGNFTFSVQWTPDSAWMDSDSADNSDSQLVFVDIPFVLTFDLYSLNVTPDQPYIVNRDHVLSVGVDATDAGNETIDCVDEHGRILNSENVSFTVNVTRIIFECPFNTNETGQYPISLRFASGSGQNYTTSLQMDPSGDMLNIGRGGSSAFLWLLIPFTLVLIGALVAGVVLTRKPKELANVHYVDIENDGFEPEELTIGIGETVLWTNYAEDEPHTVTSKSMVEGKLLFHSDDLDDHDEFSHTFEATGTFDYGCKHSEDHLGTITVFDTEDEDLDEIIIGAEDFDEDVLEMGFEEGGLEDHWDDEIVKAEAEVEAVRVRQAAELVEADETAESLEDEEVVMRVGDEDATLNTELSGSKRRDIDKLLAERGELRSIKDDEVVLTASDAEMRAELYALTGEEGVMPGDEVRVDLGAGILQDSSDFVGNELPSAEADFTLDENNRESDRIERRQRTPDADEEPAPEPAEEAASADCGGCGASVPLEAKACHVCGARFE